VQAVNAVSPHVAALAEGNSDSTRPLQRGPRSSGGVRHIIIAVAAPPWAASSRLDITSPTWAATCPLSSSAAEERHPAEPDRPTANIHTPTPTTRVRVDESADQRAGRQEVVDLVETRRRFNMRWDPRMTSVWT
jgi:hypothetical protein